MFYRLTRTFVAIPITKDKLLFKSDTRTFRVEGAFASMLSATILSKLDGRTSLDDLAQSIGVPAPDLRANLDTLVGAGALESSDSPLGEDTAAPGLNLVHALTTSDGQAERRIRTARIAIFGLEGIGELVAEQLAEMGFQRLCLVDPFDPRRDQALAERLDVRFPNRAFSVPESNALDRALVLEQARGSDLLISTWDRGYDSGNHWVNRASNELGVPAIFCAVGGMQSYAGPFVVPGMSACFMCSRMRAVAAADNYEEAMASEHFFDQLKRPGLRHREFFSSALSILAALIATDAYKYIVLQFQPALLGQIIEFDPLTLGLGHHVVLEHPQCPVCVQKKTSHVIIPAWQS